MRRFTLIAVLLLAVPFVYSLHEIHHWAVPGISASSAAPASEQPSEVLAPAELEVERGDGAMIRLAADLARVWHSPGDEDGPYWIELNGNVAILAPEGEVRAAALEFEPATGTYYAPVLSFRPVSVDSEDSTHLPAEQSPLALTANRN